MSYTVAWDQNEKQWAVVDLRENVHATDRRFKVARAIADVLEEHDREYGEVRFY